MNYMIVRDDQEYGPYSLADLQRYVASGEISLSDLARSEGMTESLPVSQVIGTIAMPPAPTYAPAFTMPAEPPYPDPPNLHWALVLLFTVLSCGFFLSVWGLVLSIWVRKPVPKAKAFYFYSGYVLLLVAIYVISFVAAAQGIQNPFVGMVQIVCGIVALIGRYSLKNSLEEQYDGVEKMGVQLSGIMVFFFAEIYIQYHINDIVARKKLDRLSMRSTY